MSHRHGSTGTFPWLWSESLQLHWQYSKQRMWRPTIGRSGDLFKFQTDPLPSTLNDCPNAGLRGNEAAARV
jgi:hypothetical protein